jgi:hypothetical protein
VGFVRTAVPGTEWLRMRFIACEDVATPAADRACCYTVLQPFDFKLTPKLSGRNM